MIGVQPRSEIKRRSVRATPGNFPIKPPSVANEIRTPRNNKLKVSSDEDDVKPKPKFATPKPPRRVPIIVTGAKSPVRENDQNSRAAANGATPRRENINDNVNIEVPKLQIREPGAQTPNRPSLARKKIVVSTQPVSKTPRSSRRRRRAIDLRKDDIPIFTRFSKTPITPRRQSLHELSSDLSDSDDTLVLPTNKD